MKNKDQIRKLPGVDTVLAQKPIADLVKQYGHRLVTSQIRQVIESSRGNILAGKKTPTIEDFVNEVKRLVNALFQPSLRRVINATGIIIHTNLGRAPLGQQVLADLKDAVLGYTNLEYNLTEGKRGHRGMHIRSLLGILCGAENALVVNNNAAGIVLALHTLAYQKEVIISRGELVEIGGSFRIPEIMAAAGARMVEVGTTNKTRLKDYEDAITSETALILKVHKSNYSIQGFTQEVSLKELVNLAHPNGLAVLYDLGSGLLRNVKSLSSAGEPDVRSSLADGVDVVAFSGDKILGGPQSGILVGKRKIIEQLSKAPLMRALRVGKLTLAALSSVVRSYLDEKSTTHSIPVWEMLHRSDKEIERCGKKLLKQLLDAGIQARLVKSIGRCGGGTLPNFEIDSYAVTLVLSRNSQKRKPQVADKVFKKLLDLQIPIIGILRQGEFVLDLLTIFEKDLDYVGSETIRAVSSELA